MSKLIGETYQKQNIHRRTQWLSRYIEKQRKQLSPENLKIFLDYNTKFSKERKNHSKVLMELIMFYAKLEGTDQL